jgi:hypothetical protein
MAGRMAAEDLGSVRLSAICFEHWHEILEVNFAKRFFLRRVSVILEISSFMGTKNTYYCLTITSSKVLE